MSRLDEIAQRAENSDLDVSPYSDRNWLLARVRKLESALRDIAIAKDREHYPQEHWPAMLMNKAREALAKGGAK